MPFRGFFQCKGKNCRNPCVIAPEELNQFNDLQECEPSPSNVPQYCFASNGMKSSPLEIGELHF